MTDSQSPLRVFIGKHPCDDLPYINGTDPDPRDTAYQERYASQPLDHEPWDASEDFSGWYVRQKDLADNLAGRVELAGRYGVQPNTVAVWTQRHDTFPEPLMQVGGRVRVWWIPDVDEWVESRKR